MRDALRHAAAEFIGIYALVFIGSAVMIVSRLGTAVNLVAIALAHGLTLAVMVTALMRVSGHFNPAVTIGFLVARRIAPTMAGIYMVAQLLGAMAAAYTLKSVFAAADFEAARGGGQMVASGITAGSAYLLEGIGTFILTFVVFGTAVDPHAPRVGGLAIGLTYTAGMLALGPLTGASLNPARSFGPAVASGVFEGQVIYWVGPVLGGAAAALLYDFLFLRRGREPMYHGPLDPNPERHR
jgi:aquaporin Z